MLEIDNRVDFHLNEELLNKIANKFTSKEIELIITDDKEIKDINREQRDIDRATDVLSFPLEDFEYAPLGSIVISIDRVKEKSIEFKHSENEEFTLLFIHGLLHLLGFDHEIDNGEMRDREEELIREFNLPKSLIIRNC